MLKALFSSNTRVKILQSFLLNPDTEFFVRQLTRICNEQVNSIRRELENLEKIGLLSSRYENRKKYFKINKKFSIFSELKSIFQKSEIPHNEIAKAIQSAGEVKLLVFSGIFVGKTERNIDLLIVGDVHKKSLERIIEKYSSRNEEIKYSVFSKENFLYRLEFRDKFVQNILTCDENIIAVNSLKKSINTYLKKKNE